MPKKRVRSKKTETPTIKKRKAPKYKKTIYGPKSPVRPYRQIKMDANDPGYVNRVLVATPTTGNIRMEWALARWGQVIPMNWSQVQMVQWVNTYAPFRFAVPDAQNVIVKEVIEKDFEWLLLVEHDNILPADAFMRYNKYMREEKVPVVSGLYFSRSEPSEPLVFRGRGTSVHWDWKMGEKVWVDGVPTGMLLVHRGILKAMWDESPEYVVNGVGTRRIFNNPRKVWFDGAGNFNTLSGTTDLEWCTRVIDGGYFEKGGWKNYQNKKYPFLVDTNIFGYHIAPNGQQFPNFDPYKTKGI